MTQDHVFNWSVENGLQVKTNLWILLFGNIRFRFSALLIQPKVCALNTILSLMERHQQLCRKEGSMGGKLGRDRVKSVLKEEWYLLNFRTEELGSFPLRKRGLAGMFTCSCVYVL